MLSFLSLSRETNWILSCSKAISQVVLILAIMKLFFLIFKTDLQDIIGKFWYIFLVKKGRLVEKSLNV